MRARRVAAALLAAGALACGSRAETNGAAGKASDILVTARGRPLAASRTPGRVSVLDSSELAPLPLIGVGDAAERIAGVTRVSDGPWGSEVAIRGLTRESVVLLIDGCRVNTATDHGARLGTVHPLEIDRIEILQGPISSLYGSGAMGGVVNVITKSGRFSDRPEAHAGLSLRGGSNPEGWEVFGHGAVNGSNTFWYVSQGWRDYESYEDGAGEEVRNSQFEDRSTRLRAGWKPTERLHLEANLQYMEGENIGIPGTGTAPLPAYADVTGTRVSRGLVCLTAVVEPTSDTWTDSRVDLYHQFIDRRVRIDHFPYGSPIRYVEPGADHETWGGKWINTGRFGDHEWTGGLDAWRRTYEGFRTTWLVNGTSRSDLPLPDSSLFSGGVFAEDDWSVRDDLVLNLGGRLDVISVENDGTQRVAEGSRDEMGWDVHAGSAWRMSDEWTLKSLVASGYRAASLEERFQYLDLGGGAVKVGNPDLDPERSMQVESEIGWAGARAAFSVSAFYHHIFDLIGDRWTDPATIRKENISEAELVGVELEGEWDFLAGWTCYGNAMWMRGRDTDRDEALSGIPPFHGMAGICWAGAGGLEAALEAVFAGRQDDVPENVLETSGWVRTDARVAWACERWGVGHRLFAGVKNVFDYEYRDALTTYRGMPYDEPGRNVFGGYEAAF